MNIKIKTWGEEFEIHIDRTEEDTAWVMLECNNGREVFEGFLVRKVNRLGD